MVLIMRITKRGLSVALGALWLIDGVLQLKPAMFTQAFIRHVILPNARSQPLWVSTAIQRTATIAGAHIVVRNALFAALQLPVRASCPTATCASRGCICHTRLLNR